MLTIPTDIDLETRLYRLARSLGKTSEQCALEALKAWVADHEESQAHARRLGGGVMRPPTEDFYD
ncbi:MAG: hypothetical protein NVV74_08215 [Magnetospirillum sp.]|nr:hypothetical protein [Magnetospirillum sp.]